MVLSGVQLAIIKYPEIKVATQSKVEAIKVLLITIDAKIQLMEKAVKINNTSKKVFKSFPHSSGAMLIFRLILI